MNRSLCMLWIVLTLTAALAVPADMTKPRRSMSGNLVQNGRFEDPSEPKGDGHTHGFPAGTTALTGWTVSGGGIDVLGDFATRRVNIGSRTTLSQKLNLTKGTKYVVSFIVSTAGPKGVKTGVVRIAGQTFPFSHKSAEYEGDRIWTPVELQFVGTGPTPLEITGTNGEEHGPHIADVYLGVEGAANQPAGPADAAGDVVDLQGDVLTLNQTVKVAGKPMTIRTKFYLTPQTHYADKWKPTPGAKVKITFKLAEDGRKMITDIGPGR